MNCFQKHESPCPAPDHVDCGPVVALLQLDPGHWVYVCEFDLNSWLDKADAGELPEPSTLRWVRG